MKTMERPADERLLFWRSMPYFAVHFMPLMAIFTGVTWTAVILLAVTYSTRMFAITAGYHRYFSHRTYRMGRVPQFLMAAVGLSAAQKSPLWWAAHHRHHHRFSDTELDVHSPRKGFWWSHVGWVLCDKYKATDHDAIKDFAKYPELRWMDRHDWVGPWVLGVICFLVGGWSGLWIGFFLSTVLVWNMTFTINSLAHVIGRRRYETGDDSKNSLMLALVTFGEGWHNNHHRYQSSTRQGFAWWQIDLSYMGLRAMQAVGLVSGLRQPPARILLEGGYPVRVDTAGALESVGEAGEAKEPAAV